VIHPLPKQVFFKSLYSIYRLLTVSTTVDVFIRSPCQRVRGFFCQLPPSLSLKTQEGGVFFSTASPSFEMRVGRGLLPVTTLPLAFRAREGVFCHRPPLPHLKHKLEGNLCQLPSFLSHFKQGCKGDCQVRSGSEPKI